MLDTDILSLVQKQVREKSSKTNQVSIFTAGKLWPLTARGFLTLFNLGNLFFANKVAYRNPQLKHLHTDPVHSPPATQPGALGHPGVLPEPMPSHTTAMML